VVAAAGLIAGVALHHSSGAATSTVTVGAAASTVTVGAVATTITTNPTTNPTTTTVAAGAAGTCRPSARHPYPVVLVPGTLIVTKWNVVEPALTKLGYCVHTFNYGNYGTAEIAHSAKKLATFVDTVLAGTHAKKVSIVGHSQGGMMARYYVKFLGGKGKVDDLIGLSPSNHGTVNPAIVASGVPCEACNEQLAGSAFLQKLNRGSETPGPVDYTVLETLDDLILVPYTSAFLSGPSSRVTNVTLQSDCPAAFITHLGMPSDPIVLQWIENALGRKGPASPNFVPTC
jgi:triacylglycerol lipase